MVAGQEIEFDENYWDCECEQDYIQPKSQVLRCNLCGAYATDQPPSRVNEILHVRWDNSNILARQQMLLGVGIHPSNVGNISATWCELKPETHELFIRKYVAEMGMRGAKPAARAKLKEQGYKDWQTRKIWTTNELQAEFEVKGFRYGIAFVKRRSDGKEGGVSILMDEPERIYFDGRADW